MLKRPKEEIANMAYSAALRAMQTHNAVGPNGYNMGYNSVMGQLTDLIALAVQAGVREMLNNTYTNEEFERDLGLKT